MFNFQDLLTTLTSLKQENKALLVAIDGRGGSGKTTLAQRIQASLPEVSIIHVDDIVYPMGGADRKRLQEQVLIPLTNNKQGRYQIFDHVLHKLTLWKNVEPQGIVIIEGVSTLHPDLLHYFNYTIWVECPAEIGMKRGVARELRDRGEDVTKAWKKYMEEEKNYIEEERPQGRADIIIPYTEL